MLRLFIIAVASLLSFSTLATGTSACDVTTLYQGSNTIGSLAPAIVTAKVLTAKTVSSAIPILRPLGSRVGDACRRNPGGSVSCSQSPVQSSTGRAFKFAPFGGRFRR